MTTGPEDAINPSTAQPPAAGDVPNATPPSPATPPSLGDTSGLSPRHQINFLRGFIELLDGSEVPTIFSWWSALGAVSCVLGRRCWADWGLFHFYPNNFIVLVAASGSRKSTAIMQAKRLLLNLTPRPNIVAQKITPEALIDALRVSPSEDSEEGMIIRDCCDGFGIADELVTFLSKAAYDSGLGDLLIKLYDCDEEFPYRTRGRGVELLQNVCFGMLSGTTIDRIRAALPPDSIGSGLTARMVFVYSDDQMKPVYRPTLGPDKRELMSLLIAELQRMLSLNGQFVITPKADDLCKEEYEKSYYSHPFKKDPLLGSYFNRRLGHIVKTAMCISVCERSDLTITQAHMDMAIRLIKAAEVKMPTVMSLLTSNQQGSLLQAIEDSIKNAGKGGLSVSELLSIYANRLRAKELKDMLDTLYLAGHVRKAISNVRGTVYIATVGVGGA